MMDKSEALSTASDRQYADEAIAEYTSKVFGIVYDGIGTGYA
jgi:hypothetical protein